MDRREFTGLSASTVGAGLTTLAVLAAWQQAHALSLDNISNAEAGQGLKAALEQGAVAAVGLLGQNNGFLNNPKVRIPLPGFLDRAAKVLKSLGQGQRIDELVTSMNRAAETAVPMGKNLLVGAVKNMNVNDARNILTGGETSVTRFFAEKTRVPLGQTFLPVVTRATEQVGLAAQYNQLAGRVASMGLVRQEDANIQQYVTGKTLDGLYLVIGEEEKKIRQDPLGSGSAILKKVFGAMK